MLEYSRRDLQKVFSLSPLLLQALADEGHIHPVAIEGAARYSFQDLLTLRTTSTLRRARIPGGKIREALRHLRAVTDTAATPSLTPGPTGRGIAVAAGDRVWSYESGQYALPLAAGASSPGAHRIEAPVIPYAAAEHFERALAIEAADPDAARTAYAACLALLPEHQEARVNLGRLLHQAGELTQASDVYRGAAQPGALLLLHFAALLEEQNRLGEALEKYRRAVMLDPLLAERHCAPARLRSPELGELRRATHRDRTTPR